jgi:hypothetical protein
MQAVVQNDQLVDALASKSCGRGLPTGAVHFRGIEEARWVKGWASLFLYGCSLLQLAWSGPVPWRAVAYQAAQEDLRANRHGRLADAFSASLPWRSLLKTPRGTLSRKRDGFPCFYQDLLLDRRLSPGQS